MCFKNDDLLIRESNYNDAKQLCDWWSDGKIMAHAGFSNGLHNESSQDNIRYKLK